jgi:epoxide hydrolase
MGQEIVPFRIEIAEAELADLRRRLRQTRWPEHETVADWSQGVPLVFLRKLCDYWADGYDWRATEARLNALPQFRTEIDGIRIVFAHVRSPNPEALPLILTHGWPGSVVEFMKVIGPLSRPGRRLTPSTWCARRFLDTDSAASRSGRAGESSGSPGRGRS